MTPFQFLNNRNFKLEWMAAFIVTASTSEEIISSLKFARTHSLGVAIMATGHDLADRNAGPGPNSLLIRTTCFRNFQFIDNHISGFNGRIWTEGYAIVGAGLTFGYNFWTDIENAEGLYPLTAKHNKELVGGSCHSVGIVGWTIGGGKGLTSPMYGLGVDQLLHVELVSANGSILTANFTHKEDLFYAIRGGGGGFGIVTSMKIKLHNPSCDGSMEGCYSYWNTSWLGEWDKSSKKQQNDIKRVLSKAYEWKAHNDQFWNGFVGLSYNTKKRTFSINVGGFHFGKKETKSSTFYSFRDTFKDLTFSGANHSMNNKPAVDDAPPVKTNKYWCFIFPDPDNTSNCNDGTTNVRRWEQSIRFLVNHATIANKTTRRAFVAALY